MARTAKIIAMLGLLALCSSTLALGDNGLISHWEFDEGEGGIAYDSVGDNHGTISGAEWTSGQINGALDFDGDDDYVEIGPGVMPVGDKSFFAWVKIPPVGQGPPGTEYDYFIYYGESDVGQGYIILYFNDGTELRWLNPGGFDVKYTVALDDDKWHFVGITYDGTLHRLYLDGNEVASSSGNDHFPVTINEGIGGFEGDMLNRAWEHTIDDVRIYDSALSAEEVEQLYEDGLDKYELAVTNIQRAVAEKAEALERIDAALDKEWAAYSALEELLSSGHYGDLKKGDIGKAKKKIRSAIKHEKKPKKELEKSIKELEDALAMLGWEPPFPVSHWTLDEDSGDIAYDSAGDNDGIVFGALWTTGIFEGALSFDGDDDYVSLGSPVNLDDLPLNDLTISAWIYDSHSTATTWGTIFGAEVGGHFGWSFRTFSNESGDRSLHLYVHHTTTIAVYHSNYSTISQNTWHHVVGVWNAGTKTAKLYIDGAEPSYQVAIAGNGTYKPDASNDKEIGRIPHTGGRQYFDGIIDDVRIYDTALSEEEVRLLYYNRLD